MDGFLGGFFEELGPAGLIDQPKGAKPGSKLPELTKRTILMLKQSNPAWGCQRISDMLLRGPALPASPAAVARVMRLFQKIFLGTTKVTSVASQRASNGLVYGVASHDVYHTGQIQYVKRLQR